ncbi:MAG: hypothetical protein FJ267_10690 [Planctomycetes bacterium]|nr:hypothetical protein [Planctomycetota bacterium]
MKTFDWQFVLAVVCVVTAGIVLLRKSVLHFRESDSQGCHSTGCHGCSATSKIDSSGSTRPSGDFVSIESLINTAGMNQRPSLESSSDDRYTRPSTK